MSHDPMTHYLSTSKGLTALADMHSAHLDRTADMIAKDPNHDPAVVANMRRISAEKVDAWEAAAPDEYAAWAAKNPEKHQLRVEAKAASSAQS